MYVCNHRGIQFSWGEPYDAHVFQVNCCWFPGVAPFLVGHLSGFMVHVHKSQWTSSVCLTAKKWKGSTIQTRDSLCVSHRGSKRLVVSSSPLHSHPNLERSRHTQASFLLVSSLSTTDKHWLWVRYQWCINIERLHLHHISVMLVSSYSEPHDMNDCVCINWCEIDVPGDVPGT